MEMIKYFAAVPNWLRKEFLSAIDLYYRIVLFNVGITFTIEIIRIG